MQEFAVYWSRFENDLEYEAIHFAPQNKTGIQSGETIPGFLACEDYFFRVQVFKPYEGPLSKIAQGRTDSGQ